MFIRPSYSTVIDPLLRDVRTYLSKSSGIKKGDKALDVGCGTGDQVFYYAKRGIVATGIDSNPEMIHIAKQRKERSGLLSIFFELQNAKKLPFKDNYFDSASISLALHEIEEKGRNRVISEMKRVVKKGGSLIFVDFRTPLPNNISSYLIRSVKYLTEKTNFDNFKSYLRQGGLPALLKGNRLKGLKRRYFKWNTIAMIKARNIFK